MVRSLFTLLSNPVMSDHSDQLLSKANIVSERAQGSTELAAIVIFKISFDISNSTISNLTI